MCNSKDLKEQINEIVDYATKKGLEGVRDGGIFEEYSKQEEKELLTDQFIEHEQMKAEIFKDENVQHPEEIKPTGTIAVYIRRGENNSMGFTSKDIQKVFQELIKDDYLEITKRISKYIKEKRQNNCLFGYNFVNGVPTINQEESKIVKWIYERYLSYSAQPPLELVNITLERAKQRGEQTENVSYKEAKLLVGDYLIKEYMANELSLKELYYHVLSEKGLAVSLEDILVLPMDEIPKEELKKLMVKIPKKVKESSSCIKRVLSEEFYSGATKFRKSHDAPKGARPFEDQFIVVKDHHEAIISPEMWAEAQEANKRNQK